MDRVLERLSEVFSWERISAFVVDRLLPDLAVAAILLTVYVGAWRLIRRVLRAALKRSPLDPTAGALIERIVRAVVFVFAAVSVLKEFGIDTAGIRASMGILGLTLNAGPLAAGLAGAERT